MLFVPCILHATPAIDSVSGTAENGESLTILSTATNFTAHADYGGAEDYLCRLFDNFEDNNMTSWSFVGGGTSWENVSTGQRTNSTYSAHKKNETQNDRAYINQGGSNTYAHYYVSFYIYLASDYPNSKVNDKFFRAGSQPLHGSGYPNIVWGDNSGSAVSSRLTVEYEADGNTAEAITGGTISKGAWHFVEIIWGMPVGGETDDFAYVYVNNSQENALPHTGDLWWSDYMTRDPFISIGTWFNTADGGIGSGWYYDDVYISFTQARVVIGDNATYSSCTHLEAQVPTAWSTSSITVDVNVGSFAADATAYVFVFDDEGNHNTVGEEITIGGESEGGGGGAGGTVSMGAGTSTVCGAGTSSVMGAVSE